MKKLLAATAIVTGSVFLVPGMASAAPAADGRCVAQGAGFTFDGPAKAGVARAGLMSTVILDHAFDNADFTESLVGGTICD